MNSKQINEHLNQINNDWVYDEDNQLIKRHYKFKNFTKTMSFVNAVAQIADQEGHHPDVPFGYNYCYIAFTTHDAKGLTIKDFICVKKIDKWK